MKLITTIIFTLGFSMSLMAQGALEIELNHNINEATGDDFEVELSVSNFSDLVSFQLFLNWDERIYRINEVLLANEDLPFFDSSIILPSEDVSIPDPGKVRIIWADFAPVTLPDETLLVRFSFTALGQSCEISDFTLENIGDEESEELLVLANDLSERDIDFNSVGIQVPGLSCTSNTADLLEMIDVQTFPNPVTQDWNISFSQIGSPKQLYIYDNLGKMVFSELLSANNQTINLGTLIEGIYLYKIVDNDALISHGKINKIR